MKSEDTEKQRERENKGDNKEQDTLPYSSFQRGPFFPLISPHPICLYLVFFSSCPLLNYVGLSSILTAALMPPERWPREIKEAREREGEMTDGGRQTDFKTEKAARTDGEKEKGRMAR